MDQSYCKNANRAYEGFENEIFERKYQIHMKDMMAPKSKI
jgi:hypothetical protein